MKTLSPNLELSVYVFEKRKGKKRKKKKTTLNKD
jgi:hypothetical protein